MQPLPTIDIVHPRDPGRTLRINVADYDAAVHRRIDAAPTPPLDKAPGPDAASDPAPQSVPDAAAASQTQGSPARPAPGARRGSPKHRPASAPAHAAGPRE